jgi:hypothetical protein
VAKVKKLKLLLTLQLLLLTLQLLLLLTLQLLLLTLQLLLLLTLQLSNKLNQLDFLACGISKLKIFIWQAIVNGRSIPGMAFFF